MSSSAVLVASITTEPNHHTGGKQPGQIQVEALRQVQGLHLKNTTSALHAFVKQQGTSAARAHRSGSAWFAAGFSSSAGYVVVGENLGTVWLCVRGDVGAVHCCMVKMSHNRKRRICPAVGVLEAYS